MPWFESPWKLNCSINRHNKWLTLTISTFTFVINCQLVQLHYRQSSIIQDCLLLTVEWISFCVFHWFAFTRSLRRRFFVLFVTLNRICVLEIDLIDDWARNIWFGWNFGTSGRDWLCCGNWLCFVNSSAGSGICHESWLGSCRICCLL